MDICAACKDFGRQECSVGKNEETTTFATDSFPVLRLATPRMTLPKSFSAACVGDGCVDQCQLSRRPAVVLRRAHKVSTLDLVRDFDRVRLTTLMVPRHFGDLHRQRTFAVLFEKR